MGSVKVPKSWHKVSIRQYIDLLPSKLKNKTDIQQLIYQLSVLSKKPIDEVKKISVKEATRLKKKLVFLNTPPAKRMRSVFWFKGSFYKVYADRSELSFENYTNSTTILKDLSKDAETTEKNIHLLMATVCIPVRPSLTGWKKKEYNIMDNAEKFKDLPIPMAYPIIVFFCKLSKVSHEIIRDYSNQKMQTLEKELKEVQKDLANSTDGL